MFNLTLGQLLDIQAERYPNRDAVVYYFEK